MTVNHVKPPLRVVLTDVNTKVVQAWLAAFDDTPEVTRFAETLERVCIETVESGQMTKDLALLISRDAPWLNTQDFLAAIDANLQKAMA